MQAIVARKQEKSLWESILMVCCASIIVGMCSPLSIPLWFSPIPLALQGSIILFFATFMNRFEALSMVLLFILQGAVGLPVFAGGASGFFHLLGPRGGYILGYAVSAFFVAALTEKSTSLLQRFGIFCLGNWIIYAYGVFWLSQFIGVSKAFLLGVCPFILGDVLKAIFFTCLTKTMQRGVNTFWQ